MFGGGFANLCIIFFAGMVLLVLLVCWWITKQGQRDK